ncbi:hypothetical protein PIB30_103041, partial [Stylosanthes scabra]|nr:hypothetical protein [Stylosanthes scabra]
TTAAEEADQLQRNKKKVRNDGGGFGGETSKVPRLEPWMLDKTAIIGDNGKPRTYADLVMHGSSEPLSESDNNSEEEEGSSDEGEPDNEAEAMELLEMS